MFEGNSWNSFFQGQSFTPSKRHAPQPIAQQLHSNKIVAQVQAACWKSVVYESKTCRHTSTKYTISCGKLVCTFHWLWVHCCAVPASKPWWRLYVNTVMIMFVCLVVSLHTDRWVRACSAQVLVSLPECYVCWCWPDSVRSGEWKLWGGRLHERNPVWRFCEQRPVQERQHHQHRLVGAVQRVINNRMHRYRADIRAKSWYNRYHLFGNNVFGLCLATASLA